MPFCQPLQCHERIGHFQEIGIRKSHFPVVRQVHHHKVAHAPSVEVGYVFMPIVALRLESEEEGTLGEAE